MSHFRETRKVITAVLFAICCTVVDAQSYVRTSEESSINNCIVKSYDYYPEYAVCYGSDGNTGYIEMRASGTNTRRIPIPLEYTVCDMKVYNHMLYFCGRHIDRGFVGIANLFQLSQYETETTCYVAYMDLDIEAYSLDKLVVFGDDLVVPSFSEANEHVIALASSSPNTTKEQFLIHIKYENFYMGTDNGIIYNSNNPQVHVIRINDILSPGIIPYTPDKEITLQELLLTDDYIAVAGYNYLTDKYVIYPLKKVELATFTYNSYEYQYSCPQYEAISVIKAVSLNENNIAVASLAANNNQDDFEIRIRNIDLNTMLMTNSQALNLGNHKNDVELAYNINQDRIILLINHMLVDEMNSASVFFEVDPWATTTQIVNAIYHPTPNPYTSIDNATTNYYTSVSNNTIFWKSLPHPTGDTECMNRIQFEFNNIDNTPFFAILKRLEKTIPLHNLTGQFIDIVSIQNNIECITD